MDEVLSKKQLSDWKDKGLTDKTIGILAAEEVMTMEDFALTSMDDRAEFRKAGVSIGQMNRLSALLEQCGGNQRAGDLEQSVGQAQAHHEQDLSNTDSVKNMLEKLMCTPSALDSNMDNHDGDGVHRTIKDVRAKPELDSAGNLWEFLIDKHTADPLLNAPPGGASAQKTGYVQPTHTNISNDDPRAILIMRATTNRAIHITNFLSEETKKRLRNKRQQYLVQQGDSLTMKIRDEHPYAGISVLEYGAANMRLLNYLLNNGRLDRDKVEFYLAYTTLVFELGDKYEWRDVLNFDFQYRERQAELGFDWGSMVSVMELQLLSGSKNRNIPVDPKGPKWNPNARKPKQDICRNFANSGDCVYGSSCKFKHINPSNMSRPGAVSPPGTTSNRQGTGLYPHPPLPRQQSPASNTFTSN